MTTGGVFDIIMLALPRWDSPYSSTALSLAKALAKTTRVFYIDNPVTLAEFSRNKNSREVFFRRRKKSKENYWCSQPEPSLPNFFLVTPDLTLPINWLPPGRVYETLSNWNDRSIAQTINTIIRAHRVKQFVFVNSFNPLYGNALKFSMKPLLRIYQCVDDITQAPYLEKHGPRLEEAQIRGADFTLVTSETLRQKCLQFSAKTFLLPNAADSELFNTALSVDHQKPEELERMAGKKIITYIGNICQRIDYTLIRKIAENHPDKCILMIGPRAKTPDGKTDYASGSAIDTLANVVFVGSKKQEDLPAFLRFSDCCIIPFLCNDLTKSIYPLKVNEYLSAGRAVVSTAFSEDILGFRQVVKIAENHQQFVAAIDKTIEEDSHVKRIERLMFSASNNWEARARSFIELVVEFSKHHDRGTGLLQRRDREQTVNRF